MTLTLDQVEDIMAAFNAAGVWHKQQAAELARIVGTYDLSISTVDRMHGHELQARVMDRRWTEFYQVRKVLRAGEVV